MADDEIALASATTLEVAWRKIVRSVLSPLALCILVILTGCASVKPTQPPLLSPFGDGSQWIVWEDINFEVRLDDNSTRYLRVPRGFVTDLASTPPQIWRWYPPFGKYLTASILHDYLYWRQSCTQLQADKIFAQTMRDAGVPQEDQSRFFVVLQEFGKRAMDENSSDRERGLIRVLPERYLDLRSPLRMPSTNWKDLREELQRAKVPEPYQPSDTDLPKTCEVLGKEITVKTGIGTLLFGR